MKIFLLKFIRNVIGQNKYQHFYPSQYIVNEATGCGLVIKLLVNCIKCIQRQKKKKVQKGPKGSGGEYQCLFFSVAAQQRQKRTDTDCSSFSAVIQGSALTIHTHYISAGGLGLRLPNQGVCHSLKRREEKKKIRGFSGQEPILSMKSIISLQHARNL